MSPHHSRVGDNARDSQESCVSDHSIDWRAVKAALDRLQDDGGNHD